MSMDPTPPKDPGLNPGLKSRRDDTYDTQSSSPPPVETTSLQREEGRGWPIIWAVVVILCIVLAVYILVF